jgi:hypothetical protein
LLYELARGAVSGTDRFTGQFESVFERGTRAIIWIDELLHLEPFHFLPLRSL